MGEFGGRLRKWASRHNILSAVLVGLFCAVGLIAVFYLSVFSNLAGNSASFIYSQF